MLTKREIKIFSIRQRDIEMEIGQTDLNTLTTVLNYI